ncbi:MAG: ATP-binding protein [Nannocystaceae bacterium]
MDPLEALRRRLQREVRARQAAEQIAEEKTRALFEANQALEERAARLTSEVEGRTHELREARERAASASASKSAFIANLSHELRTPLNAIIGYGEMLHEDVRALELEDLGHDTERILSAANYLLVLINDLLDLEKIEAGQLAIHLEEVELRPLIASVLEIIGPQLHASQCELEVNTADAAPTIVTDSTRLRQILHNVLANACKFTHKGTIHLAVYPELRGEQVFLIFEVRDTGIGIAPEHLPRLFERFVQADETISRRFGGTGLGLALTRRLCERLGGDITAASKLGVGSTFRFWLPLDPPLLHADVSASRG